MSATQFALADGARLTIVDATVTVTTRGGEPVTIDCSQITSVSRGGAELIVTRREADPVVVRAATLPDARAIEDTLASSCGISPLHARRWSPGSGW